MEIRYIQEHTSCLFYATEETALFRQYQIAEGQSIEPHNRSEGIILYTMVGDASIIKDGKPVNQIGQESMAFVSRDDKCSIKATTSAHIITCSFSKQLPLCARYSFSNLIRDYEIDRFINNIPPPSA